MSERPDDEKYYTYSDDDMAWADRVLGRKATPDDVWLWTGGRVSGIVDSHQGGKKILRSENP